MTTAIELREGDVYHWRYTDARLKRFTLGGDPYWCTDQQAVVRDGKLLDTYWSFGRCGDSRVIDPADVDLTFVCNINDVREVRHESETKPYGESDVFNLSYQHGCYKKFAVRKGAERSADRMLREIAAKVEALNSDITFAKRNLEHLAEMRAQVEAGDLSPSIWW